MKKPVILASAFVLALGFCFSMQGCGGEKKSQTATDSPMVDTNKMDSPMVDSPAVDTSGGRNTQAVPPRM